jgi:diguanylate cyclase (GGDEF)-like protein
MTLLYAGLTWTAPNRPAMVAVALPLLALASSVWLGADRLLRSDLRRPVNIASVLVHVIGYATLSHLDGGIASPLGALVYFAMVFLTITIPLRPGAVFAAVAVAAYWTVALLGAEAPPGYALLSTLGFLAMSWLCARHAQALASLRRRLTEVSRVDPLTGCLNRRGFDIRLEAEISRSARTGRPVTLVVVDLDSFKSVNDSFGHQVGDELLTWTGRTLRETGRTGDIVSRLGGDEFAVILPDAGPDDAAAVVARVRARLDDVSPASMGHASCPAEAADPEALQRLADRRVYLDKAARTDREQASEAQITAAVAKPAEQRARVSTAERRQRSIADMGWIATLNFGIGIFYLRVLAEEPRWPTLMMAVLLAGLVGGVAVTAGARFLARTPAAAPIMFSIAPVSYGLAVAAAALDGGLHSPVSIGVLTPLPLIALTSPRRISVPVVGGVAAAYVAMGLFIGTPSGWYLVTHLAGVLAISAACAHQGATAASQRKLLIRLSRVDGLTGALNRRGFEERFAADLAHCERHGTTLSLLVLDLDGFKALNDTEGHAAGDDLLRWVSGSLTDLVRVHDVTGRLGGDEFVALLTDCPADQVGAIAERVRSTLAERTAVSIGTATLGSDGTDFDTLYHCADERLYAEKRSVRRGDRMAATTAGVAGGHPG